MLKHLSVSRFAIVAGMSMLFFAGCKDDDSNPTSGGSSSSLVGTWELTEIDYGGMAIAASDSTITMTAVLAGSTYTMTIVDYTETPPSTETMQGSWTTSGNKFITTPDDGSSPDTTTFALSGNTLTLTETDDSNGTPITAVSTFARQ